MTTIRTGVAELDWGIYGGAGLLNGTAKPLLCGTSQGPLNTCEVRNVTARS
jgi:hypothetical protein